MFLSMFFIVFVVLKNLCYNYNDNKNRRFDMNTNYLEKLEFYKIIEILSNFCCTYCGKELAFSLVPSNNTNEVQMLLQETRRSC